MKSRMSSCTLLLCYCTAVGPLAIHRHAQDRLLCDSALASRTVDGHCAVHRVASVGGFEQSLPDLPSRGGVEQRPSE